MAVYHQSDLSAWARCPAQVGYKRAGLPDKTNSAAAYGSVMHHVLLNVLERQIAHGVPFEQALRAALDTFTHYWNPLNISEICEPVPPDGWLPRQGYSELRAKGLDAIRKYADMIRYNEDTLLATEYEFIVPIVGTWDDELGEPHWLAGAIDHLSQGLWKRWLTLKVNDLKTGREYKWLRYNLQFTAYCYATTQREFWVGARGADGFGSERGEELFQRLQSAGRRGTWINLRTFKYEDAGWRGPIDYSRFALAVEQMHASITADIFPLTIYGEACRYCDYRSICGGTGLPDARHGEPGYRPEVAS